MIMQGCQEWKYGGCGGSLWTLTWADWDTWEWSTHLGACMKVHREDWRVWKEIRKTVLSWKWVTLPKRVGVWGPQRSKAVRRREQYVSGPTCYAWVLLLLLQSVLCITSIFWCGLMPVIEPSLFIMNIIWYDIIYKYLHTLIHVYIFGYVLLEYHNKHWGILDWIEKSLKLELLNLLNA